MGVSLSKGGNVSLTKSAPGLTAVNVGLGWDVRTTTGADFDLDASALLVDTSGLPDQFGAPLRARSNVAVGVGVTVLGCWTGA